ncbi:MAG: hypothetical protein NVS1B2_15160 [Vulcanimicrobiaceae bacterium]
MLRAIDVRFVRDGVDLVTPFSLALGAGDYRALVQPSPFAASLAARLCGAIVRPTHGTVFVGDYETRLQPPQAKRRVGFVDAAGFVGDAHAFACEVAFHAECWNRSVSHARARARDVLDALVDDESERDDTTPDLAYARAIGLALVVDVALLVLDRPPDALLERVRALVPHVGVLATVA